MYCPADVDCHTNSCRPKCILMLAYPLLLELLQVIFRALVGAGYQTLQSLLLDFCKWQPSEGLLYALLDMLVDGNFNIKKNAVIKVGNLKNSSSIQRPNCQL